MTEPNKHSSTSKKVIKKEVIKKEVVKREVIKSRCHQKKIEEAL